MSPFPEEEWEEEEEESSFEEEGILLCPVCGSPSVRLVEMRDGGGFYECEACGATFEDNPS